MSTPRLPKEVVEKVVELLKQGVTHREIVQRTGVSTGGVGELAKRYGLQFRDRPNPANPSSSTKSTASSPATPRPATEPDKRMAQQEEMTKDSWHIHLPSTRIHTLEQLIEYCEVDLNIWEVEKFLVNKWDLGAKGIDGKIEVEPLYQVKAWLKKKVVVSFIRAEIAKLKEEAKQYSPQFPHIIRKRTSTLSDNVVEHSLYDHHFGSLIWGKETGQQDYDSKIAKDCWEKALSALMQRTDSFDPEGAVFVVGNDLQNADNRSGSTENLTPQTMDSRYQKVYGIARDATVWAIEQMVARYKRVHVPIVGGNHDPLASWHLGDYLSAKFHNCKNVTIDNAPTFRKWWEYGVNMVMFSHGNRGKLEDYGRTMAAEQPAMWGRTKWREAHTGDKHQRRLVEFPGVTIRILPSLRPPCGWSAENFYQSIRAAESMVWNRTEGLIGTASFSILPDNRGEGNP